MNKLVAASALTWWLTAVAAESPLDLAGVARSADGRALTNAHVFIYTAGPRVGSGYI